MNTGFFQETPGPAITSVLKNPPWKSIQTLDPPFFYMERDCQSHTPFGDFDSVFEYYSSVGTDYEQIHTDYKQGISEAFSQLESRLETLEERGLRESTCVIVTSDHGELLGEYGTVGHTTPLCPELVRVPVLFLDAAAEDFETEPGTTIEHIDLMTTLSSVVDLPIAQRGVDLFSDKRHRDWGYSAVWQTGSRGRRFYDALGAFNSDGARVLTSSSQFFAIILLYLLNYKKAKRPAISNSTLLQALWEQDPVFGTPPVDSDVLAEFKTALNEGSASTEELDSETENRLKQLGYLDQ